MITPSHPALAGQALWQATLAIHRSGIPLMSRILPDDDELKSWEHYPARDVVNGIWQARWFYHSHNAADRTGDEHGHFHFFLGRQVFSRKTNPLARPPQGRKPRPSIVHIAALSVDFDGLPISWFVTNRWVTDEWLYPAEVIAQKLPDVSFSGKNGDMLVNEWLGAMMRASQNVIAALLAERDLILAQRDPTGENRDMEVIALAPVDFDLLLSA